MNMLNSVAQNQPGYAFFDVDDTLISVKSMLSFQDYWYRITEDGEGEARYRSDLREHGGEKACWSSLNRLYYRHFAGRREQDVIRMGQQWYSLMLDRNPDFFHASVVDELRAHQLAGRDVVFVSGSFPALLRPIAKDLAVENILSTQMEVVQGCYTGRILPPQTIGDGKAEAIHQFLQQESVSAAQCYAYGDDFSDLPMLQAVGNPVVVTGGRGLEAHARELGWPTMSPR